MSFADASHAEQGAVIEADVCVIGAGPAGLAVALELADAGVRVSLLESGGLSVEQERDRRFGGTSWYGRCVTFDPVDFEARAWVPGSGWPISRSEVESRYSKAARFLGIARPSALAAGFWRNEPAFEALSGGGIAARVHLISRAKDLGRRYRRAAARSARLTALLHATVTGIEVDTDSQTITQLRVRGPRGQEFSSRARRYVIACGGLENARLLLLLEADQPGVLGPSSMPLGRCYMNHPRCDGMARLYLDPGHPAYLALVRRLTEGHSRASRCRVQLAAGLDEETQRREELLNASAFFYRASTPRLSELRGNLHRIRRLVPALPLLVSAGLARLRQRPFLLDHLVMVEQLEQAPDPESRIVLGDRRDRWGRPLLRLEWRIGHDTVRTQRRFHQLLAERLHRVGIGKLESALLAEPDLDPPYGDSAHPMGSTRMALDPRHGVVDGDCRVHAVKNLYVAGSSVFPTGGHANPTLPLVALALRLADHLRDSM